MFNLWDWIVSGVLYLFDLLLIPMFNSFAWILSGGKPVDQNITIYIKASIRMVYPIVSMLNFWPFVAASVLAFELSIVRKLMSTWHFILDLIPAVR